MAGSALRFHRQAIFVGGFGYPYLLRRYRNFREIPEFIRLPGKIENASIFFDPDPPSRCHLLRCLRSFLLAAYYLYASVGAPRRLASNTLLVPRDCPKSFINIGYQEFWWWILVECRQLSLSHCAGFVTKAIKRHGSYHARSRAATVFSISWRSLGRE